MSLIKLKHNMILKKSFSLLELIFVIIVVSILSSVAVSKYSNSIQKANILKLQAQVAYIREKINSNIIDQRLKANIPILDSLDNNDNELFNLIMKQPIKAVSNKGGNWSKDMTNTYKAWINSDEYVKFVYNSDDFTFDCDIKDKYCQEMTQ